MSYATWAIGVVALVIVQLAFAGYFVISKVSLTTGLSPLVFGFVRDVGGSFVLQLVARLQHGTTLPATAHLPHFAVLGLCGVYFGQLLPVVALDHITALNVSLLQPVQPVATFALAWALGIEEVQRDRRGVLKVGGLVLCVGGAAAVVALSEEAASRGSDSNGADVSTGSFILGNVYILFQVVTSAVFVIVQSALLKAGYQPLVLVAWLYTFGAAWVTIGVVPSDVLTLRDSWDMDIYSVLALCYAVCVSSALCYFLIGFGIKHTSPVVATALTTLQPVATAVLSAVFLGTDVSVGMGIAGALVCIGLLCLVIANVFVRLRNDRPTAAGPSSEPLTRADNTSYESATPAPASPSGHCSGSVDVYGSLFTPVPLAVCRSVARNRLAWDVLHNHDGCKPPSLDGP